MVKHRYQLPGVDNRERASWNHIKAYEAPPTPLEIPPDDDETIPVEEPVAPVASVLDAVPVRVVEFAREPDRFRDCRTYTIKVGPGQTFAIAGKRSRTRIVIQNSDIVTNIYVGTTPDVTSEHGGFFVAVITNAAAARFESGSQRAFYVHNPHAADTTTVSVEEEFITELV